MIAHKYVCLRLLVVSMGRWVDERVDKYYLCEILYCPHVYEVAVAVEFCEVEYMQVVYHQV